jgi:hypothetical protein
MATVHIALQDGFQSDSVAIRVDGREVYNKDGVTTDLRISRADGFDVEAPDAGATVEVRARGISVATAVDPRRAPYVAVDIGSDGRPRMRLSEEPFAYL